MKVIYDPPLRAILVAGGGGFEGDAVCRLLASDGALRVISVDDYDPATLPRETGNFRAVATEVEDRAQLAGVIDEERIDTIIDLTGDANHALPGAAHACWAARGRHGVGLCRYIAVSANQARAPIPHPALPTIGAIVAATYGPGQDADALIPRTILAALAGAPIRVDGAGLAPCDWLHVEDYAVALLTLLARGQSGATYHIGARATRSTLATVAMLCDLIDRIAPRPDGRKHRTLIRFVTEANPLCPSPAIDPGRIERELGWRAAIGLREGLMETIDWYRRHADAACCPATVSA